MSHLNWYYIFNQKTFYESIKIKLSCQFNFFLNQVFFRVYVVTTYDIFYFSWVDFSPWLLS